VSRLSTALAFTLLIVAGRPSAAQEPSLSQWDGVYSDEQAERGRLLYEQRCASCHARDLQGLPQVSLYAGRQITRLTPLVGRQFASNWNRMTLGDIFERIRISMPQDNPGILSRQQTADILAFILGYGGYPVGETELPATEEALSKIQFRAVR
jgi:S-disulfanyl-L-cysteine oxidoreductase SoxD